MSSVLIPMTADSTSDVAAAATPAAPPAPTPLLGTYKRAPMVLTHGAGVELFDADGKAYIDLASGIAVNALGYADEGMRAAMHAAIDTGLIHVSNLYRTTAGEQLAAWLVDHSFASSVFFCNSGAEANEGAFKFARRWAKEIGGVGKHEIVSLRGAFHGRLFASLAATDRPSYRLPFRPLAGGVSIVERDLQELELTLTEESTAAVIVEPVQGEGGVRVLDQGFLRELRALTRERRIALIFDEIQCGLGRTGTLFAYERIGVEPDLLTLAKPIAGGLPMGAVLLNAEIAATLQPGDHGTTFGGGPFVASVAQYVCERLADPALLEQVTTNGAWVHAELEAIAKRTGKVRAIRGVGMMWGIDTQEPVAAIVARARELGLLVITAGDHTLRLLPPLVMTREELAHALALLERAIAG